jgi:hypothetical protein
MSKSVGGFDLQKEIDMLKKTVADKDIELTALREQLNSKEDAMNRLEAEVLRDPCSRAPFPTNPFSSRSLANKPFFR